MGRPLGHKLSEETKAKMRKPHRKLTQEEKDAIAERMRLYHQAKKEFVTHYIEQKLHGKSLA